MSRVHEALRRAGQLGTAVEPQAAARKSSGTIGSVISAPMVPGMIDSRASMHDLLEQVQVIPYQAMPDSLLVDPRRAGEAPAEEFRTLRTRLNHIQGQQNIHTLVVTSPSPAEGKSFSAANLAITQAQLAGNYTLLADFDFRRPIVHSLFNLDRSPGVTEYVQGKIPLHQALRRVQGTNLFLMPAGEAVVNPLELLNLREVKQLLDDLPTLFNWVVIDSPPLLFAADANLLSTMCHGTLLVVRIGHTTIDSVSRAVQSLCENNMIGIVVNGARRGELYSKYTYYHSYYTPSEGEMADVNKISSDAAAAAEQEHKQIVE